MIGRSTGCRAIRQSRLRTKRGPSREPTRHSSHCCAHARKTLPFLESSSRLAFRRRRPIRRPGPVIHGDAASVRGRRTSFGLRSSGSRLARLSTRTFILAFYPFRHCEGPRATRHRPRRRSRPQFPKRIINVPILTRSSAGWRGAFPSTSLSFRRRPPLPSSSTRRLGEFLLKSFCGAPTSATSGCLR